MDIFVKFSHLFMMPTHHKSSCHVTQDGIPKLIFVIILHLILGKVTISCGKPLCFSFDPETSRGNSPPPPRTFKVRAWLNGNKMFYHTFASMQTFLFESFFIKCLKDVTYTTFKMLSERATISFKCFIKHLLARALNLKHCIILITVLFFTFHYVKM